MCYSLWYNAGRPATSWVHYTTSCNTQSSAPEDGRVQRPKHVELIGIINKPLLLHLVGVYIICFMQGFFIKLVAQKHLYRSQDKRYLTLNYTNVTEWVIFNEKVAKVTHFFFYDSLRH